MLFSNQAPIVGLVILLLWGSISCAKETEPKSQHQTEPARATQNNVTPTSYKDFSTFYAAFTTALASKDWPTLAEQTVFPFILRGELDGEGQLEGQNKLHPAGAKAVQRGNLSECK